MSAFQFSTTQSIISEPGALQRLREFCQNLGVERPVVVTDRGIVACGLLGKLQSALSGSPLQIALFCDVLADPPEAIVEQALALAKQHQADGVIGFGGGSSMDTAKLVAAMLQTGQSLSAMYGIDQVNGGRLPLILIPTTAGTGSEVTPIAIVTTGETTKSGIVSATLLPDIALLDAELTLGLPAAVTAATGIDAMVHAIEAYTSLQKKNVYSDMLAREALGLLSANIKTATFEGNNIEARQNMLLGACLAGQAFANAPVAAVHALAYPLGGHFHIPHGLSNSLVLPHVMRFNAPACASLYAELAPYIAPEISTQGSAAEITAELITHIEQLIETLKLPTTLAQMDIQEDQLVMLADDALLQTRLLENNPRPVKHTDALAIYRAAFTGVNL